jgi:hypothetical protein
MPSDHAPNSKHMSILRSLPTDGAWRTFTELYRSLSYPRPSQRRTVNALERGRSAGLVQHRPPTDVRGRRGHRGFWRVVEVSDADA